MARKKYDLMGKVFGMLTVIGQHEVSMRGHLPWVCLCECGNKKLLETSVLRRGNTISCGKHGFGGAYKKYNLLGHTFGILTVTGESTQSIKGHKPWECKCKCGAICYVESSDLMRGHRISCGNHGKGGLSSFYDLTNKNIGYFRIVSRADDKITPGKKKKRMWNCLCVCGSFRLVSGDKLLLAMNGKPGGQKSCGCKKADMIAEARGFKRRPKKIKITYRQTSIVMADEHDPLEKNLDEWGRGIGNAPDKAGYKARRQIAGL